MVFDIKLNKSITHALWQKKKKSTLAYNLFSNKLSSVLHKQIIYNQNIS